MSYDGCVDVGGGYYLALLHFLKHFVAGRIILDLVVVLDEDGEDVACSDGLLDVRLG